MEVDKRQNPTFLILLGKYRFLAKCVWAFSVLIPAIIFIQDRAHAKWVQGYQYVLVVSKENNLCQHMLSVYNKDLATKGTLDVESHAEYMSIEWDYEHRVMLGGKKSVSNSLLIESKVAVFDINNDNKDEAVFYVRFAQDNAFIRRPRLTYYPLETYNDIKSGVSIRELNSFGIEKNQLFGKNSTYIVNDLPAQSTTIIREGSESKEVYENNVTVNSFVYVAPFYYGGKYYLSLFSEIVNGFGNSIDRTNMISIRQYQKDNTIKDLCHYIKTPVFEYRESKS